MSHWTAYWDFIHWCHWRSDDRANVEFEAEIVIRMGVSGCFIHWCHWKSDDTANIQSNMWHSKWRL